jgi:hypothetical protein
MVMEIRVLPQPHDQPPPVLAIIGILLSLIGMFIGGVILLIVLL